MIDLDALEQFYPSDVDEYMNCGWSEKDHLALIAELRGSRKVVEAARVVIYDLDNSRSHFDSLGESSLRRALAALEALK